MSCIQRKFFRKVPHTKPESPHFKMPFNLATLQETIAEAVPSRLALAFRDRRYSFAELTDRTRRFANILLAHGINTPTSRSTLQNWQSGQDHVALYLQNGNEYLEAMLGTMKARAAPFNVNYRYVAEELRYLFNNARARAVVYHARYAPMIAEILPDIPEQKLLIQVPDESGQPLLQGALDYETALAAASAVRPDLEWSPNDLYILYTGGTTGMPKGVLWRQADILASALGARRKDGSLIESLEEFAERASVITPRRYLPTPPFMHGTAQWIGLSAWHSGHSLVIQDEVDRFDPDNLLNVIDRHEVNVLSLVGDAFGKPFLDALETHPDRGDSLTHILNGGAGMSPHIKAALIKRLKGVRIIDTIGSSEAGPLARHVARSDGETRTAPKQVGGSAVLSEDKTALLKPGSDELGWLAKTGIVPLGYLGDAEKTAATFPVIDAIRYAVPGDRVRLLTSGDLDFQGRDSSSINTGGEKVFSEEVERALGHHPGIADVLVSWRASERWGQEVVAIVVLKDGHDSVDDADLLLEAGRHLARYKLPKLILRVDRIGRHDNGKPDYRWAKTVADESLTT
ncbi:MAG: acyl-CoA synthetase [Pseudomonadota bacterium]